MKQICYRSPYLGCDPELFVAGADGNVIGAEKFMPEAGLQTRHSNGVIYGGKSNIVIDGVQIEFHTSATSCRANIANEIAATFRTLKAHLAERKDGSRPIFDAVVKVSKKEMESLSDKSRELGCAPSLNFNDAKATISASAKTSLTRAAGGHIHFGLSGDYPTNSLLWPPGVKFQEMVPVCNMMLGIPGVLIDRDPEAATRRKTYGRAGEFRLPNHGLEYRTLSNFWLRSYQLFSIVFGLAKQVVGIMCTYPNDQKLVEIYSWDARKEFLNLVDQKKVAEVINTNDLAGAKELWQPIKQFLAAYCTYSEQTMARQRIHAFDLFTQKIEEEGIGYWFPEDPLEHWCGLPECHSDHGAEKFLDSIEYNFLTGRRLNDFDKRSDTHTADYVKLFKKNVAEGIWDTLGYPINANQVQNAAANAGVAK